MKSVILFSILISSFCFAKPQLSNITEADLKTLTKGFGAHFAHGVISNFTEPAKVVNYQLGIVTKYTMIPKIEKIVKRGGAGFHLPTLQSTALAGTIIIPSGISFEASIAPKIKADQASFSSTTLGVKWNLGYFIPRKWNMNWKTRVWYSKSEHSFKQIISSNDGTVKNETASTGVQTIVSRTFYRAKKAYLEPYAGFGIVRTSNALSVGGTPGTVFDTSFSAGKTETLVFTGYQYLAGLEYTAGDKILGAEFAQTFDVSQLSAKLTFKF